MGLGCRGGTNDPPSSPEAELRAELDAPKSNAAYIRWHAQTGQAVSRTKTAITSRVLGLRLGLVV